MIIDTSVTKSNDEGDYSKEESTDYFGLDGYTSNELFSRRRSCNAFTYDDIIVMPGHISTAKAAEVSLESNITKKIRIKVPFLSSPMDTGKRPNTILNSNLFGYFE